LQIIFKKYHYIYSIYNYKNEKFQKIFMKIFENAV
jgi:hypothetical protein